MSRFFRQLSSVTLLLLTAGLGGHAWAGAGFNQTLSLQGISFHVQATGEGSQQQLTITPKGGKRSIKPISQTVEGRVVGAEVADLNSNSLPEIYVYVQSAGSGSYGQLAAPIRKEVRSGCCAQHLMNLTRRRWSRASVS